MPERNTMKKIQELQQVKGDAYDYYIAGNEDTDLFEKIFLVDDIVEEICKPDKYFYEVDVNDDRFALRAIEIFVDRTVEFYNDLYCDVVEVCPIPTVDELNEKVWGEGFYATIISKGKFDEIWNTGIYNESLTAT